MNIPARVILAMYITVSTLYGCGGKEVTVPTPTPVTDKTISLKIENGTGLTYKVSPAEAVNYSLDITFTELAPKLSFDFVITNMDYTKGSVSVAEAARKNSHLFTDEFTNGKSVLNDRTSMVLSLEVYRDLFEAGKATVHWNNEDIEFQMLGYEEYKFEKGNGKVTETVMYCANQDKSRKIWVWKNPELPLLMKATGKGTLELTYWYLPGERP